MPDITMCSNHKCPAADKCWRYGCKPTRTYQSYALFTPNQDDSKGFKCDFFMDYPGPKKSLDD